MPNHDAIIIGTGQSGPALARRLVAAGQKVAVIERKFFGGTCVNTGCTPTKTLVASAYAAHLARRAGDYGVTVGGAIGVDMKAVKARKDAVVDAIATWGRARAESAGRLHGLRRPRQVCRGQEGRGERLRAGSRPHLHQCRRAGVDPPDPRPRPSSLLHQQLDDGHRFPSLASHHPGRQLYRTGIRAGLPPLRKRGDGDRAGAPPDPARGRGRLTRGGRIPRGGRHRRARRQQGGRREEARKLHCREDRIRRARFHELSAAMCWSR